MFRGATNRTEACQKTFTGTGKNGGLERTQPINLKQAPAAESQLNRFYVLQPWPPHAQSSQLSGGLQPTLYPPMAMNGSHGLTPISFFHVRR
jgi:hypothetical protein